jgi:hypothetical protein
MGRCAAVTYMYPPKLQSYNRPAEEATSSTLRPFLRTATALGV